MALEYKLHLFKGKIPEVYLNIRSCAAFDIKRVICQLGAMISHFKFTDIPGELKIVLNEIFFSIAI